MEERAAWGQGLVTVAEDGTVLDAWFPNPRMGVRPPQIDPWIAPAELADQTGIDERRGVSVTVRTVDCLLDSAPVSTEDVYLRLHLLSHRLVQPGAIRLDGMFGLLPIVAWSTAGPMLPEVATSRRSFLQRSGIHVHSLDRIPRMTDYAIPDRVRIADPARVRLGAHLAPGTAVTHEGFVSCDAGTLGASTIEGRLSQGVVIGEGTDIGGGASVMSTPTGGGSKHITIGSGSLIGANAGVGLSIGDNCVVEAGLYVTAGMKVTLLGHTGVTETVKAADLSGRPGLLFRRNSQTGAVEVLERRG